MSDTTYGDGTYGANAEASRDLERDQHATFTDQQAAVMALAYDAGERGITGHDVQVATGWGDSSKSRALSNLLREAVPRSAPVGRERSAVHPNPVPEKVKDADSHTRAQRPKPR